MKASGRGPGKPASKRSWGRKPGHEVAQQVADDVDSRPNSWPSLKESLGEFMTDRELRAAERVVARGGLTLLDLQGIEFAEFMWLSHAQKAAMDAVERGEKATTMVGVLAGVRLQSRKNMRSLAIAMNPNQDENTVHPTVPAEVASVYNAEVYGAVDLGDELLS